jgi:2,3-bisphosphoglycerate-independent phosphoglycerate mutase
MVLIIRDGWGYNPNPDHDSFNAIKNADTRITDQLMMDYPWTLIHTSGEEVGLPEGTMGNSEVGHQNIGAGRIVDQESVRISKAIRKGDFYENPTLVAAVLSAREKGRTVHLIGIASDAGVHGLMTHLYACLELCRRLKHDKVVIHCLTDGRDTGPYTGKRYVRDIEDKCREMGVGRVVTVCGRYYAMDRDHRWERVEKGFQVLTGRGPSYPNFSTIEEAIQNYYDNPTNNSQQGDEFITPRTIGADWRETRITDGDSVIFYNYRGDRPREITRAFVMAEFYGNVKPSPLTGEKGFDRGPKLDLFYVTMTAYEEELYEWVQVAYPKPPKMENILGEYLAKLGLKQFRCAETEKFPHVTFFFNDYREAPFEGEERLIVPSPKVGTYDLKPDMSAVPVCDAVMEAVERDYDFIVVNFANCDMVGHTGKLEAAVAAVETVDRCVGAIVAKTLTKGGSLIVTADHGNAEQMWSPENNSAHTAHTHYDVPCIIVDARCRNGGNTSLRSGGNLADIVPTALQLMGLEQPEEMEGKSLLAAVPK